MTILTLLSQFDQAEEKLARGRVGEALRHLTQGLELEPYNAAGHSQLLVALHYLAIDRAKLAQEHQRWARMHLPRHCEVIIHTNVRDPERRLRLAYFATDFRPYRPFVDGVLAAHDPESFELIAFVNAPASDLDVDWLSARFNRWQQLRRLSDPQVAQAIREEEIDILVDLEGHNPGNRLRALALKPAPLQVGYLGYPTATAVPATDYLLGDRFIDAVHPLSQSSDEGLREESLVALDAGYLCYSPTHQRAGSGEEREPSQPFMFGIITEAARLDSEAIRSWCAILERVPGSRLRLCCTALNDETTREGFLAQFAHRGLSRARLLLPITDVASERQRFAHLRAIDLTLDPFPCTGVKTVCESLWMGVPVVSRRGQHRRANIAASLLTRVGLDDCIADTAETYVDVAVRHALIASSTRVALRGELRQRARETLGDYESFTRGLESTLRTMWQRWCKGRRSHSRASP